METIVVKDSGKIVGNILKYFQSREYIIVNVMYDVGAWLSLILY